MRNSYYRKFLIFSSRIELRHRAENLKKKSREQEEVGRVRRRRTTKRTWRVMGKKKLEKMIKARGGSQRTIWSELYEITGQNILIVSLYIFILDLIYSKNFYIARVKFILTYYILTKEFWEKCLHIWEYWALEL